MTVQRATPSRMPGNVVAQREAVLPVDFVEGEACREAAIVEPGATCRGPRAIAAGGRRGTYATDMTDLEPFDLDEDEDDEGMYSLILTDDDMLAVMDVFEAAGYYGNGY